MFNKVRLKEAVAEYKKCFVQKWWLDEKYKWEMVKCFQVNWDVNADDFAAMLTKSLSKAAALLNAANYYPVGMITGFAEKAQEDVRAMFIALFDETREVYERIDAFKRKSNFLLERYGNGAAQHYQHENAICTYLWLRYPDKYYIYKLNEIKAVSNKIESSYTFKRGDYANNIRSFLAFYNEICAELQQDEELKSMLASQITDTCYPDPELRTLTTDISFFISRWLPDTTESTISVMEKTDEWEPKEYTPGLSVDEWEALLNDKEVFTDSSLAIMKRMLDYGGQATCTQLATKYGEDKNFYNSGSSALARRIVQKAQCPVMQRDNDNNKWWPVLYMGRPAKEEENGSYVWKLRDELEQALKRVDLSRIQLYANLMNPTVAEVDSIENYTKDMFLSQVYMSEASYDRLVAVLKRKKNLILQGAPGVGKTFAAKRLAYSMMGEKDDSRIEFVQFHQNYSYEDFVMGYKPNENGFELKNGIFYQFCKKAASHPDKDYFFIIDEINRGNMSKIFGELLMLIEADYRETEVTLAYNGLRFSIPSRLYIIGMMNTADRSLAMIDYALRRRFSFFNMEPGFDSEGFIHYQKGLANETFNRLIDRIKELNQDIAQDKSLGKGFCIGHSYFCNATECTEEWMQDVVEYDILPMLSEYWFDDANKLQKWENSLRGIFQ